MNSISSVSTETMVIEAWLYEVNMSNNSCKIRPLYDSCINCHYEEKLKEKISQNVGKIVRIHGKAKIFDKISSCNIESIEAISDKINKLCDKKNLDIAIKMFEKDEFTLGQSAKISKLTKEEFLKILCSRKISIYRDPIEELKKEFEMLI